MRDVDWEYDDCVGTRTLFRSIQIGILAHFPQRVEFGSTVGDQLLDRLLGFVLCLQNSSTPFPRRVILPQQIVIYDPKTRFSQRLSVCAPGVYGPYCSAFQAHCRRVGQAASPADAVYSSSLCATTPVPLP